MAKEQIILKLREFIFQELIYVASPEQFNDDSDLLEAGLDSMGIMRLVMFIEEEFGVVLPDTEIEPENIGSFLRLKAWIEKYKP